MFSIKKIINRKNDIKEAEVYSVTVKGIYENATKFRKLCDGITFSTLKEVELFSTMMDHIAALIDVYTENKFGRPSTVIGLRNSISVIGEAMAIFVECTFENLGPEDIDRNELMSKMMHCYDMLMAGTRMMIHTMVGEYTQISTGVNIIDRYYKSLNNKTNGDIKFTVNFTQPDSVLGREPKEDKHGTNKRNRTSGNGV